MAASIAGTPAPPRVLVCDGDCFDFDQKLRLGKSADANERAGRLVTAEHLRAPRSKEPGSLECVSPTGGSARFKPTAPT
jgi:hypothetical protein